MSDDFSELERSLRHLRPARVSPRLEQSISAALAQEAPATSVASPRRPARYATATSWTSWKWANWGVAAALGIAAVVGTRHASVDVGPAGRAPVATREAGPVSPGGPVSGASSTAADLAARGFQPVDALRLLVDTTDEGVVTLADGTPVRRLRERYVDSVTWRQPETNASLVVSLPREDIRFQRLALY